jgi:hypothetical protein
MINYLTNDEIDREKWDNCIKESFNGLVYAFSWYLDIVAEDWDALVEDDYERVFPLTGNKKWGINYLFQPPFTQQLGIFSKGVLSENIVETFLNSIPSKFRFMEINLNSLNKVDPDKYSIKPWLTHLLDLIDSHENIFKNYSTNLKRNLKKAEKSGISVMKNVKPDEVIALFRENRGRDIKNLKESDYIKLRRLTYLGIYKGVMQTYGAFSETNDLIAGSIFIKSRGKAIFLFSGNSDEGKQTAAIPFIIDSFIKDNSQKNLTLDFEGSNDPNLARFYKSFGSKEVTYPHLNTNRLPSLVRLGVGIMKKIKNY